MTAQVEPSDPSTNARDEIAVIGMACRFPGARNYDEYWQALREGKNSVAEVPGDRWDTEKYYSTEREDENKTVSKWGGFIDDIDKFDAPLFKISRREAELMDPQQRVMLEMAWSCFEDAGYAPSVFRGTDTGVYLGVCNYDYKTIVERSAGPIEPHISTSCQTSIIPNRLSYEYDLRGPSLPIDTACSGSLVAIENAVQALRRGDCSVALAGGVSFLLHHIHFVSFSQAGMLSADGECRAFDESANGYVRGEGAGLVLLKPLKDALRDNDRIYGLIKGVAVNHGGKVATLTSPSPFSQAKVIDKAFQDAGIAPSSVTYVEAHGTGTPKGDPIEMAGLIRAYHALAKAAGETLSPGTCGIASVKTNIGHLEGAAGIAGVIKVLLAMKHRELPKQLHFNKLNPRIKLDASPFYVVDKTQAWEAGSAGVRRAGVSSYGYGGVNAHVLLEEYVAPAAAPTAPESAQPLLFVLSAKTQESLTRYGRKLADWLDAPVTHPWDRAFSMESLAWSLQQREALEERAAFAAGTPAELKAKLLRWLDGAMDTGSWKGSTRASRDEVERIAADAESAPRIQAWLAERNAQQLGELWVKGVAFPGWEPYYSATPSGRPPLKLALPGYQFADKRYWFDEVVPAVAPYLHPVLQRNTSILGEQRYSGVLTGAEFFLDDHRVNGDRILPGVAYLEMAQAAMRLASPELARSGLRLSNVVWSRPLVVKNVPLSVHIGLHPDHGAVAYNVYSEAGGEALPHSQGRIAPLADATIPAVDLAQLKARVAAGGRSVEQHYALFSSMGIDYGPAHRAIEQLWADAGGEVLARVAMPESVAGSESAFVLHPSLLDGALQACLAASSEEKGAVQAMVPFAVSSLELPQGAVGKSPSALWVWARPAHAAPVQQSFAERMALPFDIDLCDDDGVVYVALRGMSFRAIAAVPGTGLLMAAPGWNEELALADVSAAPAHAAHKVLLAGFDDAGAACPSLAELQALTATGAGPAPVFQDLDLSAPEGETSFARRFEARAVALFDVVRQTMRDAAAAPGRQLLQVVVPREGRAHLHAALAGLLRTARLESAKLDTQLLTVDADVTPAALAAQLQRSARRADVALFRHEGERCWTGTLAELPALPAAATHRPWKEGGVYLITGGAGGLGRIFAREISASLNRAALVLTGRSPLSAAAVRELAALRRDGVTVDYRRLDVCDGAAVSALVTELRQRHGGINGVIHCAGFNRDNYIAKKDGAEFASVLGPKIDGTINLDEATRDMALDLFVMFSSTAALGNAGQADYATANAFMDQFAHYRNGSATRSGQTLSINWPLWQDGGMHIDAATARMLEDRMGMVALRTSSGIAAFYSALATGQAQVLVMEGHKERMRVKLLGAPATAAATAAPAPVPVALPVAVAATPASQPALGESRDKVQAALLQMAAKLLKLPADDLDVRTVLSEYGFDSIAYTGLANRISDAYGIDLSPAVFFDFPTIAGIAGYLIEQHPASFGAPAAPVPEQPAAPLAVTPAVQPAAVPAGESRQKVEAALSQIAAKLLKLSVEDIDARTQLSEYGFDSIAYTGLANRIADTYGIELSPAVFFDYPTIAGISGYLIEHHPASFAVPAAVAPLEPAPVLQVSAERAPEPTAPVVAVASAPTPAAKPAERCAEPIAIVGMSGSFPMSPDLASFWNNLEQGKDCISEIPKHRWDWEAIYGDPTEKKNSSNVKWGGFMAGVDEFDPLFFGISPREALLMDPQQRLLMTHVWQAIEDAGYAPSSLAGSKTGVFIGTTCTGYDRLIIRAGMDVEGFSVTGVVPSVGPNRVSYLLNLRGPSEPVETACSSSLVAIHRAMLAIEAGDCDQAIVGGVNTVITPDVHISFNKAGMLAEDGRCKTFSSQASGYVRGEGAGMLVLKKLSAAEADGDHIYGLLRGSATNHGGRANSLTSPNSKAQSEVLMSAYRKAGIDAGTVTYVEAHGTGTPLGDPVEINGIKAAFSALQEGGVPPAPCALASVKTNIGHLELAAGVAGVIKVLLQLRHRRIAPSLHCAEINPHIDLNGTRFYVARDAQDWKALRDTSGVEIPRRAGVSSFGFGGVNAHVVLEEYVAPAAAAAPAATETPVMIPLSARNAAALRRYAERLHDFIVANPAVSMADLAYTLQVGRDAMDERMGLVVKSAAELRDKLRAWLDGAEGIEDMYLGQAARNRDTLGAYANDEDLHDTMALWLGKGKFGKFFGMWVKGVSFDWRTLYSVKGRRISAPTYPFARDKFWPAAPAAAPVPVAPVAAAAPPPAPAPQPAVTQAPEAEDLVLEALRALERGVVSIDDAIAAVYCAA